MDIIAHGLWAGAAAKAVNLRAQNALRLRRAIFWGVFPDLFAFAIPTAWLLMHAISGDIRMADLRPPHEGVANVNDRFPVFAFANMLYNFSHSAVVFVAVFAIVWLLFRRLPWEMGAWLLHILIDIPTHSAEFYPTPVFWPLSNWKFLSGFAWGVPWFMIVNYTALVLAFIWLRSHKKRTVTAQEI